MSQTTHEPGFDTGTPPAQPRKAWHAHTWVRVTGAIAALILAASIGAIAAGGGSGTGSASQRPAAPPGIYANANQIVQALKAHHVPVTNVVADSGFWSGEGATSGVWATTAPGDSAAVFGGSENPVQDTEIVVFQNHAKAVAYANLGTDPDAGSPDPDHETILGTNWAVDAATPAAPGIRAALGGTLIPNVPASTAPAAPSAPASQPAAPVPVFHERTLLTLSGNGSEDTAPFTIPDGSGNWKIIWTYNEGGFGQSVNFQIWSEDFQANVNKLGTGGSGTEYVYGDPGTHHLTVNSEGAWTIKVVTAP